MASKKSASSEHTILRAGVSWRTNASTGGGSKFVVEMRPPHSKWKLHFGSYDTEFEAMAARDYAALLRDSAGEDATTAGGFNHHSDLCEFDESDVIFKSKDVFTVRCAEYKRLLEENRKENCANSARNSPFREFCKEARKDIANAIEEFRRRYPHKLQPATKDLPKLDGGTDFTPPSPSFEGYFGSYSVKPCHEGLKMQDDDGIVPGFNSSYNESCNAQPTSFKSVVTSNCDQSTSITYSGVPGSSFSKGMSVDDEMLLYCYNLNNFCQEMNLIGEYPAKEEGDTSLKEMEIEEPFDEGKADHHQMPDLPSHVDVPDHDGNGEGDFPKNDIYQSLLDEIEYQIQMDIDETDIPMPCRRTISHEEALLVAQLETQNTILKTAQAQLEIAVQQKNKLKIANLRMAKDDGVISNEEYIQEVKVLLDL